MYSKSYADRVSGAVFLIGLGLLFTPVANIVGGFFPGILFVIGATTIARGVAEGQPWYEISAACSCSDWDCSSCSASVCRCC